MGSFIMSNITNLVPATVTEETMITAVITDQDQLDNFRSDIQRSTIEVAGTGGCGQSSVFIRDVQDADVTGRD